MKQRNVISQKASVLDSCHDFDERTICSDLKRIPRHLIRRDLCLCFSKLEHYLLWHVSMYLQFQHLESKEKISPGAPDKTGNIVR